MRSLLRARVLQPSTIKVRSLDSRVIPRRVLQDPNPSIHGPISMTSLPKPSSTCPRPEPLPVNNALLAVNDSGQATGSLTNSHPFLYSNGKTIDLGTLGGTSGYGSAINSQGDVVGYALTASSQAHAFLYSNGIMKDLGVLPGDFSSWAVSINNLGQVLGNSGSSNGVRGFLFSNGVMKNLNSLIDPNSGGTSSRAKKSTIAVKSWPSVKTARDSITSS